MHATYDVNGSGVPIFRTERGKAECNLCPVLASNFVPACKLRTGFVDDNHLYVEEIIGMCGETLDHGYVRRLVVIPRGKDL